MARHRRLQVPGMWRGARAGTGPAPLGAPLPSRLCLTAALAGSGLHQCRLPSPQPPRPQKTPAEPGGGRGGGVSPHRLTGRRRRPPAPPPSPGPTARAGELRTGPSANGEERSGRDRRPPPASERPFTGAAQTEIRLGRGRQGALPLPTPVKASSSPPQPGTPVSPGPLPTSAARESRRAGTPAPLSPLRRADPAQ